MKTDELIERLQSGTGPDRKLDTKICVHFGAVRDDVMDNLVSWPDSNGFYYRVPPLTVSIDACISLAERVLPGCSHIHEVDRNRAITTIMWGETEDEGPEAATGSHDEWPRAFLIALIRAKEQNNE